MTSQCRRLTVLATALTVATGMAFGGCSDGIDLNGKAFDMLGISPAAQASKKTEPKMAERTPLVLPPPGYVLPPPGSGRTAVALALDDPDQRKLDEGKERERLHQAYCNGEMTWGDRALASGRGRGGGGRDAPAPTSPYGPCTTKLFDPNSMVSSKKE